ncbi:AGC/AKT protein kinase [Puccinia sorghi]|uniref:non-specific serine/threonine protein kinase n=1 Tax=Puccinia sorghi TaxID=27349 RepID=A0A0L6VEX7_9BASI|nr:AGC/AKT protein kinase [Puccinia sorghi]
MSSGWKLGKKFKEATNSLKQAPPTPSEMVTVEPGGGQSSSHEAATNELTNGAIVPTKPMPAEPRTGTGGTLSITIIEAEGLSIPAGVVIPDVVQRAVVENPQVGSLTVGSLAECLPDNGSRKLNTEGIQRKYNWWLPYLVLEFDKNEVLVEALGGTIDCPVWMYKADFDVSRASKITLSTYLRTSPHGSQKTDMGDDIFLGGLNFQPSFDTQSVIDAWYEANTRNGTGRFHLQVVFKPSKNTQLTIESFELLQVIGKGSFGKVMQVRKKDTGRIYAMKTIRKAHIVSRSEVTHTLAERTVLGQVNNPFIVPLKFSFQNSQKLYLVLSSKEGRFSEERSRLYAAELLCALEHLHAYDVIYRDLKPENILLDYTGHIALCDFGLCKLNMGESEKTNTFCGTPEYLSPELLLGQGYSKSVDWWTLGVLIYEMLSGLPPYYDENVNEMYRKILYHPLRFGPEIQPQARSLLMGLLSRNPKQRLGSNGAEEIKQHPFFSSIDWKRLMMKQYTPPFKPSVASAIDTSNFDSEFTSEAPMDSVVEDSHLSETVQQQFIGFTYNPTGNYMGGESVR